MKFTSFLWLLGALSAAAQTVTLTPTQDRDVYQGTGLPTSTDYSLGVSSSVAFGGGHSQKSLIRFDVSAASTGMTAAEVGQAKLRLYVLPPEAYPAGFNIGGNILISYQTKAWTENTLRWTSFSAGDSIATLTLTADHSYDTRGTLIYPIDTWVEVDVTTAVRSWLAGENPNYGFLLEPDELLSPYLSSAFADSITGWKPQLVITQAVPAVELKITAFSAQDGQTSLTWASRAGGKYAVMGSADLITWQTVQEVTADAATTTAIFTTTASPEGRGFYRIEEQP